jgi:hypothetical protein
MLEPKKPGDESSPFKQPDAGTPSETDQNKTEKPTDETGETDDK